MMMNHTTQMTTVNNNNHHHQQQQPQLVNRNLTNYLFEDRDVQRAGWLKYIPFAEKYSHSNDHKFWVVFAVYGGQSPYLEFYQRRQNNFQTNSNADGPVSKHSLLNCRHIAAVIETNQHDRHNEFSITLETHVIRLAADNEEVMVDWIYCLKNKLIQINILPATENFYSKSPILAPRNNVNFINSGANLNQNDSNTQVEINSNDEIYESIFTISNSVERITLNQNSGILPLEEGPPPYECIFNNNNNNNTSTSCDIEVHRPSFREAQVEKFKKEMEQINGLTLTVRKKDCYNAIAFVDINTYGIFVAGWKQKDHPYLHNTFHIGDQLVSINGTVMESALHVKQFIKHVPQSLQITIRRVPFGQIFCLKRLVDGEDLGLIREKGTAEINYIVPNSIADKAGLLGKCTFYDEHFESSSSSSLANRNNWYITEINNRPLNLFFKNNEVADRLNAIGKEISILVQPFGFIKRLKKQLKTFKNYKDFIVQ